MDSHEGRLHPLQPRPQGEAPALRLLQLDLMIQRLQLSHHLSRQFYSPGNHNAIILWE